MLVWGTYNYSYIYIASYLASFPSSCNVHNNDTRTMITGLLLTNLLLYTCTCIDKSMHIVLKRGSIDNALTFNIGLLQLIFHTSVFS